jgi:hypothetical protein
MESAREERFFHLVGGFQRALSFRVDIETLRSNPGGSAGHLEISSSVGGLYQALRGHVPDGQSGVAKAVVHPLIGFVRLDGGDFEFLGRRGGLCGIQGAGHEQREHGNPNGGFHGGANAG